MTLNDFTAIPKVNINKYVCEEWNGLIFVWHHPEKAEPTWYLPKQDTSDFMYLGKSLSNTYCHIQVKLKKYCSL